MNARFLLDAFVPRQSSLIQKIRTLVQWETPSTEPSRVSAFIHHWAEILSPMVDSITVLPGDRTGDMLLLEIKGNNPNLPPVLVLGHADTVWPAGTLETHPCRILDDKMTGPGVLDMKGGLALLWEWLEWCRESGFLPHRNVKVLITSDEEIGSPEGRQYIEKFAQGIHHVIVPEPPGPQGELKIRRKGVAVYHFQFNGIPAHAGVEPWKGASAILEAARAVIDVHELTSPDNRSTFLVGVIKGGQRVNVVPDSCEFYVDARFDSKEEQERLHPKLLAYQPRDPRVQVTVTVRHQRPPMEPLPETINFIKVLQKEMQSIGYSLETTATGGGSDGNFTAAMGIPTLDGMGPEGEHPHANDEYVRVSTLPHRLTLLALALNL